MKVSQEREAKLGAWPGFTLPDLVGVVDDARAEPVQERRLDAVYHDTEDLRLIRAGITVRHRTGETDDGSGVWTVKLPGDVVGGVMDRTELTWAGSPSQPPAPVLDLVRAQLRSAPLVPVARLSTLRRSLRLVDGEGVPLAEIADDEVSVLDGDRVAARFREVEVEALAGASTDLLPAVVDRLVAAGAGTPDPTPKLVRALGPRSLAPPDVVVPDLGGAPTAAAVVQAAIAGAVSRILAHDPVIRLDAGDEGVHQMRVGTRRLRSDLRSFRPLLEEAWAEGLREELRWLAAELGAVRDADVLLARLRAAAAALPPADEAAAERLLGRLVAERDTHRAALLEHLRSDRYVRLLDRLVDAARAPRVTAASRRPAADVLPELARGPWRKLARAMGDLDEDSPDEALHDARILAKRARYAAELAAPVVEAAKAHARAIAALQEVLGEHHDAIVAEGWLRAAAHRGPLGSADEPGHGRPEAFAAGLLAAASHADADRRRLEWPGVWSRASKRKLRAWLG